MECLEKYQSMETAKQYLLQIVCAVSYKTKF